MQVLTYPVGQLAANCYFAVDEKSPEAAIIDPGDDAEFLLNEIKRQGLKPTVILATHGHFDHILGIRELKLALNIPFLMHGADLPILRGAAGSGEFWTGAADFVPPPEPDGSLQLGQKIAIGGEVLEVILTPGHTPGSICFYNREDGILFSGDTLFRQGIGRTDFRYSSATALQASLKKLFALPSDTVVYPGHGEETMVGEEGGNRLIG